MIDLISQIGVVLSALGIISMSKNKKWGPLIGLGGQPFWFWISFHPFQPGVLVTTIIFTIAWGWSVISSYYGVHSYGRGQTLR